MRDLSEFIFRNPILREIPPLTLLSTVGPSQELCAIPATCGASDLSALTLQLPFVFFVFLFD